METTSWVKFMQVFWNGTSGEYVDLTRALEHNCRCQFGLMGMRQTRCNAHALLDDQRALDRLLYGRRIVDRLRDEEWLAHCR
jgi:hypothetical protein